jgi:SAM-dependent methyltransferase
MEQQFREALSAIDWQPAYDINPVGYLYNSTDPDFAWWDTATKYMPVLDKSADILDVGTWFGIMPRVLKEMGYTNVECTECAAHNTGVRDKLTALHEHFGIAPYELEVFPGKDFTLPKQYDLILILHTNMHWKIHDLYCLTRSPDQTILTKEWQVVDNDKNHTFFVPWNLTEWQTFVASIKKHLKPGGQCIIQPHPWPYDDQPDILEFLNPYICDSSMEQATLCIK